MYLYGLIVPLLSFCLQVWPRLINRYFGVDTWRFLMIADYLRENKALPKRMPQYIASTPFGYPPVMMMILASFPKKFAENYQFIFSPLVDAINNFIIFLITLFFTHDLRAAFFAQIIAALTPVIVMEASSLTARIFSHFIFYTSFLSLILFSLSKNPLWLLIAAIMLIVLFFTHKLAIQVYLVCVIALSIVERTPFYILFFSSIFGIVFIFGGKYYRPIFEDHMAVLSFFIKHINLRFAHQFRGVKKEGENKDFITKLYLLSFKNPLVYLLGNNPWLGIFLLISLLGYYKLISLSTNLNNEVFLKLSIWIYALLVAAIATLVIKKIRFLGEGNRYIEYAVLPLSIILGSYSSFFWETFGLKYTSLFTLFVLSLLGMIIYIQKKAIVQDTARTITPNLWKIINYINSQKKEPRIAFFPNTLGDPIMYFIKAKGLLTDGGKGMHELEDVMPVITKPMPEIIKKYNLTCLLIEESFVTMKELKLKAYKKIINFGSYSLIYIK